MPKTSTPVYIQNINNPVGTINNANGTALVTIWTAGADDGAIKALCLSSNDTVNAVVTVYINIGGAGTDIPVGTLTVTAGAGTVVSVAPVDVLRSAMASWLSFDAYHNKIFNAIAGTTIKIAVGTAVSPGKFVWASGDGGDY